MPSLSLETILAQCLNSRPLTESSKTYCDHITLDSRKVTPTSVFVALRGERLDARKFIPTTVAPIVIVDQWDDDWTQQLSDWKGTIVQVPNARQCMADLAAFLEDHPAKRMNMVGITGTNGKTTTTWMLSHIVQTLSKGADKVIQGNVGTIGTIGPTINGTPLPQNDGFTTPEAPGLQRTLRKMVEAGCGTCIMEVSSIGLMMHRVGSITFDVTAFTNFTQDHLDIHRSMEQYLAEKRKLFTDHVHANSTSILVVEQSEIAQTPVRTGHTTRISTLDDPSCDVWVSNRHFSLEGTHFTLHTSSTEQNVYLPLIGDHNIENALVAISIAVALGGEITQAIEALHTLPQAPGRLERLSSQNGWHAFVDYAHTPDALLQSLQSLKTLCTGRLWVLFGCGGDRDKNKRPQMGSIAADIADCVVVTSDNPRSESPEAIITDILTGISPKSLKSITQIVDRREAIAWTCSNLKANDVLLVAGKGHETYQIIQGVKHHFDDREEIARYLS